MTSSPVDPALARLSTEGRNPSSQGLDRMTTAELVALMNAEDAGVAAAVARALPQVAAAVDLVARSIHDGGPVSYTHLTLPTSDLV